MTAGSDLGSGVLYGLFVLEDSMIPQVKALAVDFTVPAVGIDEWGT